MSTAVLSPGRLSGVIKPPPSKSAAHRAILCAALAQGESVLSPVALSDDIKATIAVAETLGASIRLCGEVLTVSGIHPDRREGGTLALPCGESGSTLRCSPGKESFPPGPSGCIWTACQKQGSPAGQRAGCLWPSTGS